MKRGLVLGCGGVVGAAWTIATLGEVIRQLKWDPREATHLIGTSSGAVLAALLGAGVSVDRMLAAQRGEAAGCTWNHDSLGGALPPLPELKLTSPRLMAERLRGQVSSLTGWVGLLPRGKADLTPLSALIDQVVTPGEWAPHASTWIMVVDQSTGERVALGSPSAPSAPLNKAVCASYAVPGWCPPVEISGRTFLDGGIASPTSADFLVDAGLEEVVVLAPMASTKTDSPFNPLERIERRARKMMTGIVDREVAALRARGVRVIRLELGPEDLKAIGFNMMDPKRRLPVFETALRTASVAVRAALDV